MTKYLRQSNLKEEELALVPSLRTQSIVVAQEVHSYDSGQFTPGQMMRQRDGKAGVLCNLGAQPMEWCRALPEQVLIL